MTADRDARQEAEAIVSRFGSAFAASGSAEAIQEINPLPQVSEAWQEQVDAKHAESGRQMKLLTDALAAAIEQHDVLDSTPLNGDVPKWLPANERFHEALSALREDETT